MSDDILDSGVPSSLGSAFDDFSNAMNAVSSSHKALQHKIEDLDFQLEQKNRELKASLQETQNLKTYLDCILSGMSNCLIVIDTTGRITIFNKAAEALTDYRSEEVIGKHYADVLGKHVSERFTPFYTLKSHEHCSEGEKEICTADGTKVPVKYAMSLLTDADNKVLGAIEIFSDLTAARMLEEQMHKVEIVAALTEMAGVVAHQIRNPLSGIGGYAALLSDDLANDDPKHEMASQIVEGVQRLDEIVNNLLLLTRTEKPSLVRVELQLFLQHFLEQITKRDDIWKRGIIVKSDFPKSPLYSELDPTLMERALLTIFDNAIQAMPNGGTIDVTLRSVGSAKNRHKKYILITIEDTGHGIPKNVMPRLFEPFFTTRECGTGLGLTIARNLIKFQQCELNVESREKEGTKVMITIPILKEYDA